MSNVNLLVHFTLIEAFNQARKKLQGQLVSTSELVQNAKLTYSAILYFKRSENEYKEALIHFDEIAHKITKEYWEEHWKALKKRNQDNGNW